MTVNNTTDHVISIFLLSLPPYVALLLGMFVCMRAKAHLRVWIRARTHFVCVHVCVKCINRAYCQRCAAVEVAVAVAVSLSSLPVASN